MAYAPHRSSNQSLVKGALDGKYFSQRPDTEDPEGSNTQATLAQRQALNPLDGYTAVEYPSPEVPGKS